MNISQEEIDAAWGHASITWHIDTKRFMERAIEAAYTVRKQRKAARRERQRVELPDNVEMRQFKPCVVQYEDAGITEIMLEDCFTVWVQHDGVELGYSDEGKLIGAKVWGLVAERQRKEKDKQVVESVQWSAEELDRMKAMPITGKDPINKLPPLVGSVKGIPIERGMNETERADLERKTAEMMRYLSTLSKAPEWDGTFGVGEWMTRDGSFATVTSVEPDYLTGNLCGIPWTWNLDVTLKNPDDDNSLLRTWPKGEQ